MDDRKIRGEAEFATWRSVYFPIPEGCQRLAGGCGAIATPPPVARSDAHFDPEGVVARPCCDPFGIVGFFDPQTYPKGVASSSPGLPRSGYPGSRNKRGPTPTGLCPQDGTNDWIAEKCPQEEDTTPLA